MASPVNQQLIRAAQLRPLALGEFSPTEPAEEPRAPHAAYLKDNLGVELKAAGLLNASAPRVVAAQVTDSHMRSGQGSLAARFTVTDSPTGQVRYERELRVSRTWAPALGNVGTQWEAQEHMALYRQLLGQLFSDPAFREVARGQ